MFKKMDRLSFLGTVNSMTCGIIGSRFIYRIILSSLEFNRYPCNATFPPRKCTAIVPKLSLMALGPYFNQEGAFGFSWFLFKGVCWTDPVFEGEKIKLDWLRHCKRKLGMMVALRLSKMWFQGSAIFSNLPSLKRKKNRTPPLLPSYYVVNPPALPACLVEWGLMTDCLSVLCFCLYSLS